MNVKITNKTLHKYAINQLTECEYKPQDIESATVVATLYSKARATSLTGYKFTGKISKKKVHSSQFSNGNKKRLDHEYFYRSNIERLLELEPEDCMNDLKDSRKLVNFQVFPDSAHQAQLEHHQVHIQLDDKFSYHGAHGCLFMIYMIKLDISFWNK